MSLSTSSLAGSPEEQRLWDERACASVAGVCALLAGAIHAMVAPSHFAEAWQAGTFFVVLAVGQLVLAMALRWAPPPVVIVGTVCVHVSVIALYVASRTVDLPFVPAHDAGHHISHLPVAGGIGNGIPIYPGSRTEPVGVLDLVCLVAELVLVGLLTAMAPPRARRGLTNLMLLVGATGLLLRVLGVLS